MHQFLSVNYSVKEITLCDAYTVHIINFGKDSDSPLDENVCNSIENNQKDFNNTLPQNDALNKKGKTFASLGNYNEAIGYYDKALEIKPNDVDALYNKGLVFYSLGNYTEAIQYFDKVLEINPNDTKAQVTKGLASYSLANSLKQ